MSAAPKPAVVLLHASGSSARQWDALAQALEPRFQVHAVDLLGHGRQPGRPGATVHDEAALVQPLLTRHLESVQKGERGLSALSSVAAHVLAHVQLYSVAACTAQIVFGLLLLLGLFGRTAAGLLLFGHLFAAVLLGPRLFDSATMLLCLGLVSLSLVPSGRVLGLDSVLASRLPSWLR